MDPRECDVTIEVMDAAESVLTGGRFTTDESGVVQVLARIARFTGQVWALCGADMVCTTDLWPIPPAGRWDGEIMSSVAKVTFYTLSFLLVTGLTGMVVGRAANGRLARTGWGGIWSFTSLSSESAWCGAHRVALPWVKGAAVAIARIGASGAPVARMHPAQHETWVPVALAITCVAGINIGAARGIRSAKMLLNVSTS